ncbi:MAG: hypothetical protein ABSB09_04860 [Acidimicrobiales bacterium]|jgi:hypothetical protein
MSRRVTLIVGGVVAAAVVAVVVAVVVGDGGGPTATSVAPAPGDLIASTTAPGRTAVVLAMGHFDDPSNTFFELFERSSAGSSWGLATPPGVADNGGLVVAPSSSGALTAGFLPSADLTFSVVAQSGDGGASWLPGDIPGTIAPQPDALATGAGGQVAAVLSLPSPSVIAAGPALSVWNRVATTAQLAASVTGCGVTAVTAVAITGSGAPVLGVRCAHSDRVGLLMPATPSPGGQASPPTAPASGWRSVGPVFDGRLPLATTVLRLQAAGSGVVALAEGSSGADAELMGVWGSSGAGAATDFVRSAPLSVPTGWSVRATSVGGGSGQGMTVLLGSDSGRAQRVESVGGPGLPWVLLATPPDGSTAVADIGGATYAFVPSGSDLAVWSSSSQSPSWVRTSRITVPIQYGSSD